jgi:outer membrane protein OmpA-like peptidoglycan-associated protein
VKATPYAETKPATTAVQGSASEKSSPGAATHSDASVYFATGSAALDDTARGVIRMKAAEVMGVRTPIIITGYADKTGRSGNNVELAKQRARAVRDALVQLGVHGERIHLEQPADVTGSGSDDQARRVDMKVSQ